MAEKNTASAGRRSEGGGGISIDELLALQATESYKGTVEPVEGSDNLVKFTPWRPPVGCLCQFSIKIPKSAISEVKPTGETSHCCGKTLQVVVIQLRDEERIDLKEVFDQVVATAFAHPAGQSDMLGVAPVRRAAGLQFGTRNICICDHFIRRFCSGGQFYEEYWCYDETGAFCGTQVVPLGLPCPDEASLSPSDPTPTSGLNYFARGFRTAGGATTPPGGGYRPVEGTGGLSRPVPSRLRPSDASFATPWSGYITLIEDAGDRITFHVGCFGDGPYWVYKSQIVSINQVGICGNYAIYNVVINY